MSEGANFPGVGGRGSGGSGSSASIWSCFTVVLMFATTVVGAVVGAIVLG